MVGGRFNPSKDTKFVRLEGLSPRNRDEDEERPKEKEV